MLAPGHYKCKSRTSADDRIPTTERRRLFAVWDPDIFDLRGVLEEPAAFRLLRIKPIDRAACVRPDLFQISTRHRLRCRDGSLVPVTPNPIDVVVFGECLQKLRGIARHDIYRAAGQVTGI